MSDGEGLGSASEKLATPTGYAFRDPQLAEVALSHSSYAHETGGSSNERLEFLGDAVLGLAVARLLYAAHTDWSEGELTRARASMVSQKSLANRARVLGLSTLLRLGKTEQRTGGTDKDSILADCLEAVIGAVYLDGGMESAIVVVTRLLGESIASEGPGRDAKTAFQEWAHAQYRCTPEYTTLKDSGTEDDDGRFTVEVCVQGEAWGTGIGRSKRAAEREAAEAALARSSASGLRDPG